MLMPECLVSSSALIILCFQRKGRMLRSGGFLTLGAIRCHFTRLLVARAPPLHATVVPSRSVYTWKRKPPLAKIVATIGPVSEDAEMLQKCVDAGMRVMRINFSHATYEEAELRLKNLRASRGKTVMALGETYNLRAALLDTQGPEIRIGNMDGGGTIEVLTGAKFTLTTNPDWKEKGTSECVWVNYEGITEAVQVGKRVLLDDGLVSLLVTDVTADSVHCMIENGGILKGRRGVNLPGATVDLPALSEKDRRDITYGIKNDIDFVAASFVRKAADVRAIRAFVEETHAQFWSLDHPSPQIISKIECTEAVENFADILSESDGIMVARGDLGVEIPMEQVTNLQKWMVKECNKVGKPVIVATQMLESMQSNPRPTRAEVSDVTNAVYDGADAVMLSGESAQGKYPVESVLMMRRIINEAEGWKRSNEHLVASASPEALACSTHSEGLASAAVHASKTLDAKMILVLTKSGRLPRMIAKYRPNVPVICFCPTVKVGRQLTLCRGLHAIIGAYDIPVHERPRAAVEAAAKLGFCQAGDTIVVAAREDDPDLRAETRSLRIVKIT